MDKTYSHGVAFIVEGDTEKVFYLTLIDHYCKKHPGAYLSTQIASATGEVLYVLTRHDNSKVLIKIFVVGTISQVAHSGTWFVKRCYQAHRPIKWTVFLCYDTDSYRTNITKFYEGDWSELRRTLQKGHPVEIVDLAASADIEDMMLLDSESVFRFLEIEPVPIPTGSKGKRKMKKLFRLKGIGFAYHEGERALPLISALNFDRIISLAPIPLQHVEDVCFIEYTANNEVTK